MTYSIGQVIEGLVVPNEWWRVRQVLRNPGTLLRMVLHDELPAGQRNPQKADTRGQRVEFNLSGRVLMHHGGHKILNFNGRVQVWAPGFSNTVRRFGTATQERAPAG